MDSELVGLLVTGEQTVSIRAFDGGGISAFATSLAAASTSSGSRRLVSCASWRSGDRTGGRPTILTRESMVRESSRNSLLRGFLNRGRPGTPAAGGTAGVRSQNNCLTSATRPQPDNIPKT